MSVTRQESPKPRLRCSCSSQGALRIFERLLEAALSGDGRAAAAIGDAAQHALLAGAFDGERRR